MAYINRKHKVFQEGRGDAEIRRKRSDGRMKTYTSATDLRAWSDVNEERRQYILDLVRQETGKGVYFGKFIPIEAIINILIANKNAAIKRLQQENNELKKNIKRRASSGSMKKRKSVTVAVSPRAMHEQMGKGVTSKDSRLEDLFTTASEFKTDSDTVPESADSSVFSIRLKQDEKEGTSSQEVKETGLLKDMLKEQEDICTMQYDDAIKAVEELENIKRILDGEPRLQIRSSDTTDTTYARENDGESCSNEIDLLEREVRAIENSSSPESAIIERELQMLKKLCAKLITIRKENSELKKDQDLLKEGLSVTADNSDLQTKLQKLNEVTQERDKLRARLHKLEQELSNSSTVQEKKVDEAFHSQELRQRYMDFTRRLDNVKGLDDKVKQLKEYASRIIQAGDSKENDELLAKNDALEKELANFKSKLNEMEILKAERDCLKASAEDLVRTEQINEYLSKKNKDLDDAYKTKCVEIKNLKCECAGLRTTAEKAGVLENEKRLLLREIHDCECCMANQENEIKRLACTITCLTKELNNREQQRQMPSVTLESYPPYEQQHMPQSMIFNSCQRRCTPAQMIHSQPQIVQESLTEQRFSSVKRIVDLENKLLLKQNQTKHKLDSLQNALEKFKRELNLEKQKNRDLINRYSNQSETVTNMRIEIEIVKKQSFQDKEKLRHLNRLLNNILKKNTCQCEPSVTDGAFTSDSNYTDSNASNVTKTYNNYKHVESDSFEIDE